VAPSLRYQKPFFYTPLNISLLFYTHTYNLHNETQRDVRYQFFPSPFTFLHMSDYSLSDREAVVNTLVSRVIENAPLRELIRVYSEAVQAAIAGLSDADVVRSTSAAGYADILETFSLEMPADEEVAESVESEVVPS